jgi:hypothetical protein
MFSYNVSLLFELGGRKGGGGGDTIDEKFIIFFVVGTGPVGYDWRKGFI